MNDIDNRQDCLDVRDIIARIEELESEKETALEAAGETYDNDLSEAERTAQSRPEFQIEHWETHDPGAADELKALAALLDDLKGCGGDEQWRGDWYPITLIRRSYFVDYCQELVSDIGDLPKDIPGYLAIDWDKTADNLEMDYSTVDFDGVEYLYR